MNIQIGDIVKSLDHISSESHFVIGKVVSINEETIEIDVRECSHYERVGMRVTTSKPGKLMTDHLGQRITILEAAPRKIIIEATGVLEAGKNYAVVDLDKTKASLEFIAKNVSPEVLAQLKTVYNFDLIPINIER